MNDFENKDLTLEPDEAPTAPKTDATPAEQPAAAEAVTYSATPELTLETDIPAAEPVAPTAADAFNMPQPPQAPQPEPFYQQAAPNYTQQQYSAPQYGGPQYNPPQYQQPFGAPQPNYGRQLYNTPPVGYAQKSRLAAALLAMMFGMFGVHNFYLGYNSRATIQLVVTLVGFLLSFIIIGMFAVLGMFIWAFIEGVQLISASPARMYDGNGVITKE